MCRERTRNFGPAGEMTHILEFEKLILYDAAEAGIPLDVEIRLGNLSSTFEAKLDTGSSFCVFQRQYAEELGISIETGLAGMVGTATGSFPVFGHQVTLRIEGYEFDAMVYFVPDETFDRNVLGRRGAGENLRIALVDYEGKLYLSPYNIE